MAWYNSSWTKRKKITVDYTKVSANLTDFPVLVNLASDADIAAEARSDGFDILVTSSDEVTKLAHERVYYNNTTGQLVLWFKAPSLSSTVNTEFYIYYGNSGASDQANPTGVWKSEYKGVWHLAEASGTRYDSTSNNNDLTDNNTVTQGTGKIYKAADLEQDNLENLSIVDANQTGLDFSTDVTFSFWVNMESLPATNYLFGKYTGAGNQRAYMAQLNSSGIFTTLFSSDGTSGTSSLVIHSTTSTISTGVWTHVVAAFDISAETLTVWFNGSDASAAKTDAGRSLGNNLHNSTTGFSIGFTNTTDSPSATHDGLLEEFRAYDGLLDSNYVTTEYNNQNSPSTFYSLATEESGGGGGATFIPKIIFF